MLTPSYAELIDVLNQNSNEENEITSRYTIVIAAAKRARQIIAGDEPMVVERKGKPLSTAVNELFNDKIKIVSEGEGTVLNLNLQEENQEYEKSYLDYTTIEHIKTENEESIDEIDEDEIEVTEKADDLEEDSFTEF